MKYRAIYCVALLLIVTAASIVGGVLPQGRAINDLSLAYVLLVDYDQGEFALGLVVDEASPQPSSGEKDGASMTSQTVLRAKGKSFTEIADKLDSAHEKSIFWGHVDTIIVSDSVLKLGFERFVDFFLRSENLSMSSKLYACEGSAIDLVLDSQKQSKNIYNTLKKYSQKSTNTSKTDTLTLINISAHFAAKNTAFVLPKLTKITDDKNNVSYNASGYAVMSQNTLVDILADPQSRGYNTLRNALKRDIRTLKIQDDLLVAIKNLRTATSITCKTQNGALTGFKIGVSGECGISEIIGATELDERQLVSRIRIALEEDIEATVRACLDAVVATGADFVGLYDHVPRKLRPDQAQWKKQLAQLDFEINVGCRVEREYQLRLVGEGK